MDHVTYMNLPNPVGSIAWHLEQEGKAKGFSEGELKAKTEIALNMFRMGLPREVISEATGFGADELDEILDA